MGRRAAWLMAGTLASALALAWVLRAPIGGAIMGRTADARAGRDITAGWSDGLHIVLCGTGSPLPDPARAGPCTLVVAGRQMLVVDAGEGGARNLARWGVPLGWLDALLLTHFHSDHIDGLGPLLLMRWTGAGATAPLPVLGPAGVEQVVAGFNAAYAQDHRYRTAHHGPAIAPPSGAGAVAQPTAPGVIWNRDGLVITAFVVNHAPVTPAWGYRFEYKGRSLVISGDTAPTPAITRAATGADLLLHEALQPKLVARLTDALAARGQTATAQITRDILTYHTSPEAAADAAKAAGVKALVLTHIVPPVPSPWLDAAFLGDAGRRFAGPITVGRDGMVFHLPGNGTVIDREDLQ